MTGDGRTIVVRSMTRVFIVDGRGGARITADDLPPARPPLRAATICVVPNVESPLLT